jgi:hypothetical protein
MIWHSPVTNGETPSARYAHSATLVAGGKLLFFGGCGENSVFNEIVVLDLGNFLI